MTSPQDAALTRPWRKSRHSGGGNECVEVAQNATCCLVRDSKQPEATRLRFTPEAWAAFVEQAKRATGVAES